MIALPCQSFVAREERVATSAIAATSNRTTTTMPTNVATWTASEPCCGSGRGGAWQALVVVVAGGGWAGFRGAHAAFMASIAC